MAHLQGIDESFADKLNAFISNGYKLANRYDYFSCGYANAILQACGLKSDIEIVITQSGMKKILGQQKGKKDNAHDLTPIEVLRLPQLIQQPILILTGNTENTRLIFVEIPRRNRKMFAVIDLDVDLRFGGYQKYYNLVASVYSQENYKIVQKIISAKALKSIWYYDSTKIKSWLSEAGQLHLLPTITTNSIYKSWLSDGGQLHLLPSIETNSIYSERDATKVQQNFENSKNNKDMKEKTLFGLFGSKKSENEIPSEIKTALKFDIANYTHNGPLRKNLLGIYHENGFKVATDAHIMVKIKEDYPKEKEGKAYYANEKNAKKAFEFENRGETLTEDVLQKLMNNPIDAKYINYQVVLDDAIKKAIIPHKLDIEKLMTEAVVVLKMEQIAKRIQWGTNAELIGSVLRYPVKIKNVTFRADYLKLFLSACHQIGAKEFYVQKQTFFAKTVKGCVLAMGLLYANEETKTQPSDDFYLFENPIPLKKVLSELQAIFENKKESMKYEYVNACKKRFAEIEKILSWVEVSPIATQPSDSSDKIKKLKQMKMRLELLKEAMKSSK